MYLHNCDVEKGATEANSDGRGGHDCRAGEKPHGHGEGSHRVATCDYLGLEGHKQACL